MVILEGAVDESIDALGGLTPLEAANTPNIDVIAQSGRVGLCAASPSGMRPTSASATLSLLGCDPGVVDPSAGPLAALARGVRVEPGDRVWRLTLLPAPGGVVAAPGLDNLDIAAARSLVAGVVAAWREQAPELAGRFTATAIDATGCVLVERGADDGQETPMTSLPIDLIGAHWLDGVGDDPWSAPIARLIEIGAGALSGHPVNASLRSVGAMTADAAWIWGGGGALVAGHGFAERFALRGAIAGAADHAVGAGRLIGLDRIPAPTGGALGEEELSSLGEAAAGGLDRYDLVIAHDRTCAEVSVLGDAQAKVRAIEAIDSLVVGPALRRLDRLDRLGGRGARDATGADGFRIMIAATAELSCADRSALDFPTLVAMGGTWMEGQAVRRMIERDATRSDLRVEPGHEILEHFLKSGLRVQTRRPRRIARTGGDDGG